MAVRDILMGAGQNVRNLYVDDVFSTYLYTGNGSTQTITNGIDLAGEGGLVWLKRRNGVGSNIFADTTRGTNKLLISEATSAEFTTSAPHAFTSFNNNGFSLDISSQVASNQLNDTFASWTFRKAPKFFDVVTYTGDGTDNHTISHNLGVAPGFIVVKRLDSATDWPSFHRGIDATNPYQYWVELNTTSARQFDSKGLWFANPDDKNFYLSSYNNANASGGTYVAYLFAHDTDPDGLIQCGSFATDGSGNATVNLGWEPQYLLTKAVNSSGRWYVFDTMRSMSQTRQSYLYADASDLEYSVADIPYVVPTATGISVTGNLLSATTSYIYVAIRRPNKPPTSGTEVYSTATYTGFAGPNTITTAGFPPDLVVSKLRSGATYAWGWFDKLRGVHKVLESNSTAAEATQASTLTSFNMDGYSSGTPAVYHLNGYVGDPYINHFLRRAPGFFDVVCYTSATGGTAVPHNLGVIPELVISKPRGSWGGNNGWAVWSSQTGTNVLYLNANSAATNFWGSTPPATSSNIYLDMQLSGGGTAGTNFVAYLFASLPGISKVGSYTGNGSSQTINCGFSTGARFVLIKQTSGGGGDWYVWDTARGIVAANDPHLSLNSTAAEVTTNDSVDPDNSGFIVNQNTTTNINVSSATYIFLAIA